MSPFHSQSGLYLFLTSQEFFFPPNYSFCLYTSIFFLSVRSTHKQGGCWRSSWLEALSAALVLVLLPALGDLSPSLLSLSCQLQVNNVVWSRHQRQRMLVCCAFHLRLTLNTDVLTADDFGRLPWWGGGEGVLGKDSAVYKSGFPLVPWGMQHCSEMQYIVCFICLWLGDIAGFGLDVETTCHWSVSSNNTVVLPSW